MTTKQFSQERMEALYIFFEDFYKRNGFEADSSSQIEFFAGEVCKGEDAGLKFMQDLRSCRRDIFDTVSNGIEDKFRNSLDDIMKELALEAIACIAEEVRNEMMMT